MRGGCACERERKREREGKNRGKERERTRERERERESEREREVHTAVAYEEGKEEVFFKRSMVPLYTLATVLKELVFDLQLNLLPPRQFIKRSLLHSKDCTKIQEVRSQINSTQTSYYIGPQI